MGEIRIVGPGKTRGYPYPVCKKLFYRNLYVLLYEKQMLKKRMSSSQKMAYFLSNRNTRTLKSLL